MRLCRAVSCGGLSVAPMPEEIARIRLACRNPSDAVRASWRYAFGYYLAAAPPIVIPCVHCGFALGTSPSPGSSPDPRRQADARRAATARQLPRPPRSGPRDERVARGRYHRPVLGPLNDGHDTFAETEEAAASSPRQAISRCLPPGSAALRTKPGPVERTGRRRVLHSRR